MLRSWRRCFLPGASPLVEPATPADGIFENRNPTVTTHVREGIYRETGLAPSNRQYANWLGVQCPSVRFAIWMMRALVASNVLSRREETTLFVPLNPVQDPNGDNVVGAMMRTHRLAKIKGVL